MKPRQKTQVAAVVTKSQAEALGRVSQQRGISKQALIREGIEAVTGVAPGIVPHPPHAATGFADRNHPSFRGNLRKAQAE